MNKYTAAQSLWMVAAGLSFALMTQSIKEALTHMGVFELGLYRSLGGIAIMYALGRLRGESLAIRQPAAHFWRAVWGISAILMLYYALGVLPASTAYAFNLTAPLFFIVAVAVLFRERIHPAILLAIGGSFVGVLMLLRPDFSTAEFVASGVGLLSGLCAAMAFVMVRRLGQLGEGGVRTVFFLNIHGTVFSAIGLLLVGEAAGLGAASAAPVLGVIVFATCGQLALTRALHRGHSAAGAALFYSGIVFTVLFDAFLRGVEFSLADYAGFAMIVGFGAWALWLARVKSKIAVPG